MTKRKRNQAERPRRKEAGFAAWAPRRQRADSETAARYEVLDASVLPFSSLADHVAAEAVAYGVAPEHALFTADDVGDEDAWKTEFFERS